MSSYLYPLQGGTFHLCQGSPGGPFPEKVSLLGEGLWFGERPCSQALAPH